MHHKIKQGAMEPILMFLSFTLTEMLIICTCDYQMQKKINIELLKI